MWEGPRGARGGGTRPRGGEGLGGFGTDPLFPGRRRVKDLSGNSKGPTLVLDDDSIVDGSERIIEWAAASPA